MKQQKTTAKTSRIQPKISKIQKKYANTGNQTQKQIADNRQRMNDEMQALYARENHNPMSMGCGPMIFQMVFLMGIIGLIYQPLTYVLSINTETVNLLSETLKGLLGDGYRNTYPELQILSHFQELKTALADKISPEIFTAIENYRSGMVFGGFDLTQFPTFSLKDIMVIIPVFSGTTSLLSSVYSMKIQKKNNPSMAEQNKMMNVTMLMMPLFSVYIAFKVPAAVGIYWAISNVISVIQQIILNASYPPRKVVAKNMVESTIQRRSHEKHIRSMSH